MDRLIDPVGWNLDYNSFSAAIFAEIQAQGPSPEIKILKTSRIYGEADQSVQVDAAIRENLATRGIVRFDGDISGKLNLLAIFTRRPPNVLLYKIDGLSLPDLKTAITRMREGSLEIKQDDSESRCSEARFLK